MSLLPPRRVSRVAAQSVLVGLAATSSACAGFGLFEHRAQPAPLPATPAALQAAIELEREGLLDLVIQPVADDERWNADADEMVEIAERISRLQRALTELEEDQAQDQADLSQRPAPAP